MHHTLKQELNMDQLKEEFEKMKVETANLDAEVVKWIQTIQANIDMRR